MPYIHPHDRPFIDRHLDPLSESIGTPGDLNYAITCLLVAYCQTHELDYVNINDCLGVLDSAGKEFYRRVAIPYEDKKIALNGDVFPPDIAPPVKGP